MGLLDSLMQAGGGPAVRQLAQNFGLREDTASSAVSALLPALAQGLSRNTSTPGGMEGLLGALTSGGHQRYLEDPSVLGDPETVQDGNGILGHILGSKDVSRQVARNASAQTGLGEDVLKKMLPIVATIAMGALAKRNASASFQQAPAEQSGGLLGMFSNMLDANKDGSAIDDVIGLASRFLRKQD
jgi:hypothetical protein